MPARARPTFWRNADRLLLDGIDREDSLHHLHKAAAATWRTACRRVARWTALDDQKLDAASGGFQHRSRSNATRAGAAAVRAGAGDPGRAQGETIHAFSRGCCISSVEANVAARFDVVDDAAEAQLLSESTLRVLLDAPSIRVPRSAAPGGAIAVAADRPSRRCAEAIGKRDIVRAWIDRGGSVDRPSPCCRTLGIDAGDTSAVARTRGGPCWPASEWARG